MKKLYRILCKKVLLHFYTNISLILSKFQHKIIPSYTEIINQNFKYSKINRRLVYQVPTTQFGKLIVDTTHHNTDLCKLGAKFKTNKSSLNMHGHRSGYTPYYYLTFKHLKNKKINFGEIGIEQNASTNMWRKFFSKADLFMFEFDKKKIKNALKEKLKKTKYLQIDVSNKKSILNSFNKLNKKFDILIDDSTHSFNDQINIIENTVDFIKQDGILIIEDIFKYKKENSEMNYFDKLKKIKNNFKDIFFVEFYNINNFTASWKCEKILVLIKK
jgi:hypothetical protein